MNMWLYIVPLAFLSFYVLFCVVHARAFSKAIDIYEHLAPEEKKRFVIRTDGIIPVVGLRPPPHLERYVTWGLLAYKHPELGMCLVETCHFHSEKLLDLGPAD